MISPGRYDITSYQGATFNLNLIWEVGGTAVDLTTYSAAMQVRETVNATSTILNLSSESGITLGGTAGTIGIEVAATTMASAIPGRFVYDLEVTTGSTVTRLLKGGFQIVPEVTR